MKDHEPYSLGPMSGVEIIKNGESWTLVLVRDLRHSPEKVWQAITDPAHLREWAPFDADHNLGSEGTSVKLTTIGAPKLLVTETTITLAEAPRLLEYRWGENDMRWELAPKGDGTRLTLWTKINRQYIAMGAAGWHLCFDVLDQLIGGNPIGRRVGPDAMKNEVWRRLHAEYSEQFGIKMPSWTSPATSPQEVGPHHEKS